MEMAALEARVSRNDRRNEPREAFSSSPSISILPVPSSAPESQTCCGEKLRSFWADDGRYISVCMRCGKETTHPHMVRYNGSPWIGVDLDGTLAREAGDTQDPERIGEPIEPMMQRVRQWIAQGKTVKIFTARASVPRQIELVKHWLKAHELPDLEVTNAKDFKMVELWDDRAVRVARNSGQPLEDRDAAELGVPSKMTIVARKKPAGSFVSKLRMFFAL